MDTKNTNHSRLRRISHYESLFDEISGALTALKQAEAALERLRPAVDELRAYYESDAWKQDFSADEAGLLPRELKRGVLSEDGIFLLLEELEERQPTTDSQ